MRACSVDLSLRRGLVPFLLPTICAIVVGAVAGPWRGLCLMMLAAAFLVDELAAFWTLAWRRFSPASRSLLAEAALTVDEAQLTEPPRVTLCGPGRSPTYDPVRHVIALPPELAKLDARARRTVVLHEAAHARQRKELLSLENRGLVPRIVVRSAFVLIAWALANPGALPLNTWIPAGLSLVGLPLAWQMLCAGDDASRTLALEVEADLFAVRKVGLTFAEYEDVHHQMLKVVHGVLDARHRSALLREPEYRKRHCAVRDALREPTRSAPSLAH